jgi:hypothetical protein
MRLLLNFHPSLGNILVRLGLLKELGRSATLLFYLPRPR